MAMIRKILLALAATFALTASPAAAERVAGWFYRSPFLPAPLADRVALMEVESTIQVSRSI